VFARRPPLSLSGELKCRRPGLSNAAGPGLCPRTSLTTGGNISLESAHQFVLVLGKKAVVLFWRRDRKLGRVSCGSRSLWDFERKTEAGGESLI